MLNNCLLTGNLQKFILAIGSSREGERASYRLFHLEIRIKIRFYPPIGRELKMF
jgi:hypothetical protein